MANTARAIYRLNIPRCFSGKFHTSVKTMGVEVVTEKPGDGIIFLSFVLLYLLT